MRASSRYVHVSPFSPSRARPMSQKVIIKSQADYLDHMAELLRFYKQERGMVETASKSKVPRTTNHDIEQLTGWWKREYQRVCGSGSKRNCVPCTRALIACIVIVPVLSCGWGR